MEGGWQPRAWRHLCISVNSKTQRLIGVNQFGVVVNKTNTFLKDMISNYNETASSTICVMALTKPGQGENVLWRSFFGKLTDMNIYGQAMSSEQMLAWTQCRKRPQGDILSWEQAIWEEKDLIAKEEPLEAVRLFSQVPDCCPA